MSSTRRSPLFLTAAAVALASVVLVGCVPPPPKNVRAIPGDGTAIVAYDAPLSSSHEIRVMPGDRIVTAAGDSAWIDGLQNGTAYTFMARARVGTGGWSGWSEPSAPVVPTGAPTAPTITRVAGFVDLSGCTARVTFTPRSNGGLPVTGYEVAVSEDAAPVRGTTSPIEVTGLLAHKQYRFTVKAFNARGASPVSATFTGSCS